MLLEYVYTSSFTLDSERDLLNSLHVADALDLKDLINTFLATLKDQVNLTNYVSVIYTLMSSMDTYLDHSRYQEVIRHANTIRLNNTLACCNNESIRKAFVARRIFGVVGGAF